MSKVRIQSLERVADAFVEQMAAWGVRFVFGIPGGSILPIVDAIRRSETIRFILVRHEATAAFMASAYGKLTGKLGVCTAISGAGATNLITGLADAAWDGSPVLAITGQVGQELIGSGVFQEIDQYGLFSSISVYHQVLQDPTQTPTVLIEAMKAALLQRSVSHIGIPVNLQAEEYCGQIQGPDTLLATYGEPHPDALDAAARVIRSSPRIVILAGRRAWSACDEIAALSEKLSAPVATTPSAKGLFDEYSPRSLGVLGRLGRNCTIDIVEQADLTILIGADIVEQRLLPKMPTVQIVYDPLEVAVQLKVAAALVGEIGLSIKALNDKLPGRRPDGWREKVFRMNSACIKEYMENIPEPAQYVDPRSVIDALSSVISDDAVVALDIGDVTYWYTQYFRAVRQRTLISSHLASMGFSLPAALAAKLEYPDRQVICIAGDGGFAMSMADFTTAVKYNLPIIVILFNNSAFGRVTGEQQEMGLPDLTIELTNPDFAAYARSCGGFGIRVERKQEIRDALRLAIDSDLPSIVEVLTDRSIHAVPTLAGTVVSD